MRSYALIVVALALPQPCFAQAVAPTAPYSAPTSPAADEGALGAVSNPAQWGVLERPALDFWWSDRSVHADALDNWGFALGRRLGFSAARTDLSTAHVTDYQLGLGWGAEGRHLGLGYGWSGGDSDLLEREDYLSLGALHRPNRFLSVGLVGRTALGGPGREGQIDLAARPLGDPRLLVFAGYDIHRKEKLDDGRLVGGLALRPVPGLQAALKWREQGEFQVSLGLSLLHSGVHASSDYRDGDRARTDYLVRVNPPVAGADLDASLRPRRRLVEMPLQGALVYQRARYGSDGLLPLRELTERIQRAQDDPTVAGVAVNLSGLTGNAAMLWEVREKLLALRHAGKRVVAYVDRGDLAMLYLASAADRVILDPQALWIMPGLQSSRTYQRDLLEKIGVGFDEWRFLTYKSAMETYSRDRMSAADREQRQALLDGFYDEMAGGLVASGRMTRAELDSVVNEQPVLLAGDLVARGWVDRLGRWDDARAEAERLEGRKLARVSSRRLARLRWRPDEEWGPKPVISLVYLLGECAMDTGIRGRASSRALHAMGDDARVRSVVVRADSPGGDPLPCDLVANEMLRLRARRKPVLVSQGRVAASGGYWISMDADSIAVSPFTVTGSIGVIGGWFWNERLGSKLGLTSDRVQVGKSADLLGGLTLPLLGLTIPERNLNPQERELAKRTILTEYDGFVERVAGARKLEESYVRQIAEGHVYTGREGIRRRIVDRVATLDQTIESARRAAGIAPGRRVRIVEYPRPPLFRWPRFLPAWPGLGVVVEPARGPWSRALGRTTYESLYLDGLMAGPGRPLVIAPPDVLPDEEP